MRYLITLLLSSVLPITTADAGLIVTVSDLSLDPGDSGFVDVFIRSDSGTDVLDSFGAELNLTGTGSTTLAFVDPPSDPDLTDPGYLFTIASSSFPFSDSVNVLLGPPAGLVFPSDTYTGGDGTLSGLGVVVPTTDTLLLSLEVTTLTANQSSGGETFSLSLNELSLSTFFFGPSPPFESLDLISSNPGTITVNASGGTSPVPEPGSGLIWLASIFAIGATVRRRRKLADGIVCC